MRNYTIQSNEITERLTLLALLLAVLVIFGMYNIEKMGNEVNVAQARIEEAEELIDIYEEDLDEYRNLLDAEKDKNAQLSTTIEELQGKLTALESDLAALKEEHQDCRRPIVYNSKNVLEPSNVTAEELKSGLLHNLRGYAKYFVEAEKKYGVNAIFLASIAALESGWGRSKLAVNNNNLFGYKNAGGKGYRKFDSVGDCINLIARNLKSGYLTKGGKYYNGVSVEAINIKYCETKTWTGKINTIGKGIVKRIGN
jgi:beta-N-acetylglucosaminidase